MLTNSQYNRLVDSCTYRQLLDLGEQMHNIALSVGAIRKDAGQYQINWQIDDETFLQIAYAAIVVCNLSLPD